MGGGMGGEAAASSSGVGRKDGDKLERLRDMRDHARDTRDEKLEKLAATGEGWG